MNRPAVHAIPIPDGGLVASALSGVHYADAYAVALPSGVASRTFAEAVFASSPRWVAGLMGLRNVVVRPLGLIATPAALKAAARSTDRIGIFPVLAVTRGEVLLGLDDRHLDFRISVRVIDDVEERLGVVATFVRFHGSLGRAYFMPVRPLHRLIVPAMLRGAVQRLDVLDLGNG